MTARALEGDRERCLAAGMDDYVSKPASVETLAASLARFVPCRARADAGDPGTEDLSHPPEAVEVTGGLDPRRIGELRRLAGTSRNFAALVRLFLSGTGSLLGDLRSAVAAEDPERLGTMAHKLKGSCANIGAHAMVETCVRLEDRGAGKEVQGAAEQIEILAREFERVQNALQRLLPAEEEAAV